MCASAPQRSSGKPYSHVKYWYSMWKCQNERLCVVLLSFMGVRVHSSLCFLRWSFKILTAKYSCEPFWTVNWCRHNWILYCLCVFFVSLRMLLEKSSEQRLFFSLTVSGEAIILRYGQSNNQTSMNSFRTEGRLGLESWTHLVLQVSNT